MKALFRIAALTALLSACASGPAPADWQINARDALEAANSAYFAGNKRLFDSQVTLLRKEIASSGRLDLLARANLQMCAHRIASLDFAPCAEYAALAQDAAPAERAYAEFLAGNWQALKVEQLPAQHHALFKAKTEAESLAALKEIKEPMARLLDAALLLKQNRLLPEGIAVAVNTASAQGWRRPLLAWLHVQAQRAEAVGDKALMEQIKRRIDLVGTK